MAQRIRDEYRKASAMLLHRIEGVTMSMGIASRLEDRPSGGDQLVMLADAALYPKAAGRNRAVTNSAATAVA